MLVVVEPPSLDDAARLGQAREPALVETFLAEAAVEALDRGVLHRLAGIDEEQLHAILVGPAVELAATELRTIVDHQRVGIAARAGGILKHRDHPLAGQREVDQDRRTLARAIVLQVGGAELDRKSTRLNSSHAN